jgi:hypothetical protein
MTSRAAFFLIAALASTSCEAQTDMRGVVELFTSQGCSSCPPADALLGKLAADPKLLVMSLPVDYWDYLGWKDTLAQPQHTARQRGYADMRGDREVYTPQAVINGATHVVGSDETAVDEAIAKARFGPVLSTPVSLDASEGLFTVTVAEAQTPGGLGEVWLCLIAAAVPVKIGRGENRGRSITYHNVVRRWVRVGNWSGHKQSWTLPLSALTGEGVDTLAVLVQGGSLEHPGPLLGASKITHP